MTTEEHDPNTQDPAGLADQAASSGGQGAPISLDESTVKAFVENPLLVSLIEEVAERKSKSVKDRRIAGLEKEVQDIVSQLNLTPEQAGKVKQIQQEKLLEQLSEAVLGNQHSTSSTPAATQSKGQVDIVGSFSKAGYDINQLSLADIEFAEKFSGDDVALANALVKRRLQAGTQNPPPQSPSAVMPGGTNVAPQSGSQAALRQEYDAKLAKVRPGDVGSLMALKQEYRKKGLDIF